MISVEEDQMFFKNIDLDGTFQKVKEQMSKETEGKPVVVISGAGPAGLLRAIQSILNGNPTTVIEKRSSDAKGRENTVALTKITIAMLKCCGIYRYLIHNKLIYPPNRDGYICVRLKDLEKAMKELLEELRPGSIQYNTTIEEIDDSQNKITLTTKLTKDNLTTFSTISNVDIFVNAEGAHSSTNNNLNITRAKCLPAIPVIAAVCKDDRPDITNVNSLFVYIGKSIIQLAITTYYHTMFLFQYIFSENFRKEITAAIILPTPGQNYIGCKFSDNINHHLNELKNSDNKEKYLAFAKHWINLAICAANMLSFLSWFHGGTYFHTGRNLPLADFEIVDIGADNATQCVKKMNESTILLAGDASATVDPTTGLGCNTAIQSSVDFLDFLWDYTHDKDAIRKEYEERTSERIKGIHEASKQMRALYSPYSCLSLTLMRQKIRRI